MMAMKKHWLDAGGPQLLVWKKGSFHPFQGDKNVESFAKAAMAERNSSSSTNAFGNSASLIDANVVALLGSRRSEIW